MCAVGMFAKPPSRGRASPVRAETEPMESTAPDTRSGGALTAARKAGPPAHPPAGTHTASLAPPSMLIAVPVMKAARPEARKATRSPTSSASP